MSDLFTKPRIGKLTPAKNVRYTRHQREEGGLKKAIQAANRKMEWANVMVPRLMRVNEHARNLA